MHSEKPHIGAASASVGVRRVSRGGGQLLAVAFVVVFPACQPFFLDGHDASDMTPAEHLEAAAAHEREARLHEARYDPDGMGIFPGDSYESTWFFGEVDYNPTQQHRFDAQLHRLQARAHCDAAVGARSRLAASRHARIAASEPRRTAGEEARTGEIRGGAACRAY